MFELTLAFAFSLFSLLTYVLIQQGGLSFTFCSWLFRIPSSSETADCLLFLCVCQVYDAVFTCGLDCSKRLKVAIKAFGAYICYVHRPMLLDFSEFVFRSL